MDRRTFMGVSGAAVILPVGSLALPFTATGLPDVKPGGHSCFIVMTRNKAGREFVFPAYYLNAMPLEYPDDCVCKSEDDHHSDGCPTSGWFYDNSNFDYDNCYFAINDPVIAWAPLPTADSVKALIG